MINCPECGVKFTADSVYDKKLFNHPRNYKGCSGGHIRVLSGKIVTYDLSLETSFKGLQFSWRLRSEKNYSSIYSYDENYMDKIIAKIDFVSLPLNNEEEMNNILSSFRELLIYV